jgi:DNA-binding MarR family transcriptional regulator/predicted GNAT family acetyltransferase
MHAAATAPPRAAVDAVRRFNRFYTRQIGVLEEGLLETPYSLTEARIIYELAQRKETTATELRTVLGLDAGYLSRLLRGLGKRGLIDTRPSKADGRRTLLSLSAAGRRAFRSLDARSQAEVGAMLDRVTPGARRRLVAAMRAIERSLGAPTAAAPAVSLRRHRPGDMGWITHRQAVLYHEEYGWNEQYEALIARIMADFLEHFDPARERCWVAERDGEIVGSVFVVRHPEREGVAKLRLLYVEPAARGLGIGQRLVHEVTRFARRAGYHTLTLWTNSVLVSARRLYEAEGYRLVQEERHHSFGKDLVGQTWELAL